MAVSWAQRTDKLFITVHAIQAVDVKVELDAFSLKVSGKQGDARRVFNCELYFYGDIRPEECTQSAGGNHRFLFFRLIKKTDGPYWDSLLKDKGKSPPWLKVDFDKWKEVHEKNKPDDFDMGQMQKMQTHMNRLAKMVPGAPGYDDYHASLVGEPAPLLQALLNAIVKGCGSRGAAVRDMIIQSSPRIRVFLTETVPANAAIKVENAGTPWFNGFYRREGETGGIRPGQGGPPVPPLPRFAKIDPATGELMPHNNNPVALQFRMSAVSPNPMIRSEMPGAMWCLIGTDKAPRPEIAHTLQGKVAYSNELEGLVWPPPMVGWKSDKAFQQQGADGRLPAPIGFAPFPIVIPMRIEDHKPLPMPEGRR